MPAIRPMATRPPSPIHPLSKAYFKKYETPSRIATIPIRFSHSLPIVPSRSSVERCGCANIGPAGAGLGGRGGGGAAPVVPTSLPEIALERGAADESAGRVPGGIGL